MKTIRPDRPNEFWLWRIAFVICRREEELSLTGLTHRSFVEAVTRAAGKTAAEINEVYELLLDLRLAISFAEELLEPIATVLRMEKIYEGRSSLEALLIAADSITLADRAHALRMAGVDVRPPHENWMN